MQLPIDLLNGNPETITIKFKVFSMPIWLDGIGAYRSSLSVLPFATISMSVMLLPISADSNNCYEHRRVRFRDLVTRCDIN